MIIDNLLKILGVLIISVGIVGVSYILIAFFWMGISIVGDVILRVSNNDKTEG